MPAPATQCPFCHLCLPSAAWASLLEQLPPKETRGAGRWHRNGAEHGVVCENASDFSRKQSQKQEQTFLSRKGKPRWMVLICLCHVSLALVVVLPQNTLVRSPDPAAMLALQASCTDGKNRDICPSSAVAPSRKPVPWQSSPRCERSKAVRHGETRPLGQEGSGKQQPITASWCQQGFRSPSPRERRSRALSGPILVLFPSTLLLTVSFSVCPR